MSKPLISAVDKETTTVEKSSDPHRDARGLFATLTPYNHFARRSFNETVRKTCEDQLRYQHVHSFLQHKRVSPLGDSGNVERPEPVTAEEWEGCFILSLDILPKDALTGWRLGSEGPDGESPSDFLLCPRRHRCNKGDCKSVHCKRDHCRRDHCLTYPCKSQFCHIEHCASRECDGAGIAPNHLVLQMHPILGRISLVAHQSVTVTQPKAKILHGMETHILSHEELINIGHCAYVFKLTENFNSLDFERELIQYRRNRYGQNWHPNRALTPAATGFPVRVGQLFVSPKAVGEGTFGKVFSAWKEDGQIIYAMKRFKMDDLPKFRAHINVMKAIKFHKNVLHLEGTYNNLNHITPDLYAVYTPYITATLAELISGYRADLAAKFRLTRDYLNGLAWLEQKEIIHRDIKPLNLGILNFATFQGVILDLDEAIIGPASWDHSRGTVNFLAPEVLNLKDWDEKVVKDPKVCPPPYDSKIDVFALGLSIHGLLHDQDFSWQRFADEKNPLPERQFLTSGIFNNYWTHLRTEIQDVQSLETLFRFLVMIVGRMTAYYPAQRSDARYVFALIQTGAKNVPMGSVTALASANTKRIRDEVDPAEAVKKARQG